MMQLYPGNIQFLLVVVECVILVLNDIHQWQNNRHSNNINRQQIMDEFELLNHQQYHKTIMVLRLIELVQVFYTIINLL